MCRSGNSLKYAENMRDDCVISFNEPRPHAEATFRVSVLNLHYFFHYFALE